MTGTKNKYRAYWEMKILRFFILAIFILGNFYFVSAQNRERARFESLVRLGDAQYNLGYHQNAIDFYNRAIALDSSDAYVNYQLGQSFRALMNYKQAQQYYQKASEKDLQKFPLAHFYYALMLKYDGKYESAIAEFQYFIEQTKDISPATFSDKRAFFQRSLVEMEGCYWSIEQLMQYKCLLLPQPANSKSNDFASTIFSNDSDLLIVSGRQESKLQPKNSIGEAYTNFFRFQKLNENWEETEFANKFSKINSKFNEGQGCFNQNKTEFFFTSCGRDDSYCKIYVSYLQNEKWNEPQLLNVDINAPECDNKQPAISMTGDTLYFVSNRVGGFGQNDIWMSVKVSNEWQKAINLGDQINTPFNEISPFVYPPENALFFSSDGLKGFGGLDVFIAKMDKSGNFVTTNLATPFNSNLDDCYFTLGNQKGYLSSNRNGGVGEFDIYEFVNPFIKSKFANYREKLEALSKDLATIKYDIDKTKPDIPQEIITPDLLAIYDRILSAKYAALVYDVILILNEADYSDFQKLTMEDKSIIDLMYMSDEVNMNQSVIDSIKNSDLILLSDLASDEKEFVDRMAQSYLNTTGGAAFVKMNKEDKTNYANLKLPEKQKFDKLISLTINNLLSRKNQQVIDVLTQDKFGINTTDSNIILNQLSVDDYEKIISVKVAAFIHNISLRFIQSDFINFEKMSVEESSLCEMDFKSRAFEIKEKILDSLRNQDNAKYYSLSSDDKKRIDNLAQAIMNYPSDSAFVPVNSALADFYKNQNVEQKRATDRLIAFRINKFRIDSIASMKKDIREMLPNIDTVLVDAKKQAQYQQLLSVKIAAHIHKINMTYTQKDYAIYQDFSPEDKGLFETIYNIEAKNISESIAASIRNDDKNYFLQKSEMEQKHINSIASLYISAGYNSPFVKLKEADSLFYGALSLDDKKKTDRLIALRLSEMVNSRKEAIIKYVDIVSDDLSVTNPNEVGQLFNNVEIETLEKLLAFKVASYIHNLTVPMFESDYLLYKSLTMENLSILDMLFSTKLFALQDPEVLEAVKRSDENQYKKLKRAERDFIDRLANIYILSDENAKYVKLMGEDSVMYASLSIEAKYKTDRLLLFKLKRLIMPPPTVKSTEEYLVSDLLYVNQISKEGRLISPQEYSNFERVISNKLAALIHGVDLPQIEEDFKIEHALSLDDKSILAMMLETKKLGLKNKLIVDSLRMADQLKFDQLKSEKKAMVDRILKEYVNVEQTNPFIKLSQNDSLLYSKLKTKDKAEIDRMIACRLRAEAESKIISQNLNLNLKKDELNIQEITKTDIINLQTTTTFERILAFKMANFIYNVQLPFVDDDFKKYQALSMDDKSILDMMFMLKSANLSDSLSLDSIRKSDKILFAKASYDDVKIVDILVNAYSSSKQFNQSVTLPEPFNKKYELLDVENKFRIDRFFCAKLMDIISSNQKINEAETKIVSDNFTESIKMMVDSTNLISNTDIQAYEKILSFKLANYIHSIKVPFINSDFVIFKKLTIEDKSIIEMMFDTRIMPLADSSVKSLLILSDQKGALLLDSETKKYIESIVKSYSSISYSDLYIHLSESDSLWYSQLSVETKNKVDRIISLRLSEILNKKVDNTQQENTFNKDSLSQNILEIVESTDLISKADYEAYERILSFKTASFIYESKPVFIKSDNDILNRFSIDDLSIIDMMYISRIERLQETDIEELKFSDKLLYKNLNQQDKDFVDRVALLLAAQKKMAFISLNEDDSRTYAALNLMEKNKIDRILLSRTFKENKVVEVIPLTFADAMAFEFYLEAKSCLQSSVSGQISNNNNKLSGVKLWLNGKENEFSMSTYTDKKGNFSFTKVDANFNYSVSFDEEFYKDGIYYINKLQLICSDSAKKGQFNQLVKDTSFMFAGTRPVENVYFDFDKSIITDEAKTILDNIIRFCKENKDCNLILNACTDNKGNSEYNQKLSTKRGHAVFSYLKQSGIEQQRITLLIKGEKAPVAPNSNPYGRKLNRRVEIVIMKNQ